MAYAFFMVGTSAAVLLLALLVLNALHPQLRVWPTPAPGSWQSLVFWPLFRLVNVAAFATAVADASGLLGLPPWFRGIAVIALATSGAAYGYALFALGKGNTYCQADGLVTEGIYRWTRNPQYATVIPVYLSLAVAADSGLTYLLSAAMIGIYVMMALLEEPWLEASYGDGYRRYRRRVPRFFNWHRARVLVVWLLRHAQKSVATRLPI